MNFIQEIVTFITLYKTQFLEFVKEYQFLGGVVGGGALAGGWQFIKRVPTYLTGVLNKQFTIEITINKYEYEFHQFIQWYDKQGYANHSRTLRLSSSRASIMDEKESTLSAGFGRHWFWKNFRPFLFIRRREQDQGTDKIKEQLIIRTWGRSQKPIRDLIKDACPTIPVKNRKPRLYKYMFNDWEMVEDIEERKEKTINLPEKTKSKIFNHLERFMNDKDWYIDNGLKHRTGLCFYGPAGTGKTSLARHLSHKYHKDLYFLSLNGISDSLLARAIDDVPPEGLILIEDIDSFSVAKTRRKNEKGETSTPLTMSALLNTLDGIKSCSERIVIITTNHVDRLDSALLRPGRIDIKIELGYLNNEVFKEMIKRFYPKFKLPKNIKVESKVTPAEVENAIIEYKGDPEKVILKFCKKRK